MMITMQKVESSNVEAIGWRADEKFAGSIKEGEADTGTLRVLFKGGSAYDYMSVTRELFENLMTAKSIGSYIHRYIKPDYKASHADVEIARMGIEEVGDTFVWEVLVPSADNDGKVFSNEYHEEWDTMVRDVAMGRKGSGLTERMWIDKGEIQELIPTRIMCTRQQFDRILDFTLIHYDQKQVIGYKISDEVIIKKAM